MPVSMLKLIATFCPRPTRSKSRASSKVEIDGMNPRSAIAARSLRQGWPENGDWIAHRRAQRGGLFQVRDAEDIRLVRDGLGNLNHAMAIGVCFDDREQVNIRSEFLADKG